MKKLKLNKVLNCRLEAENGFYRMLKMPSKDLPRTINIPFMYKLKITSPVIADSIDFMVTPSGGFVLEKVTKSKAFYRLANMYQAKATVE